MGVNKDRRVHTKCDKAESEQEGVKLMVSSSRSLFKTINSLVQPTNMMRIIKVTHSLRLCHIDLLRQMPIEKGIIYIKLAKSLLAIEGNAKLSTSGDGIYHRNESLVKVNARLLVKALSNKESFIPCNRVVGILFDAKHSLLPTIFCLGLEGTRA